MFSGLENMGFDNICAAALLASNENLNKASTENFEPLENNKKSSFFSKIFK